MIISQTSKKKWIEENAEHINKTFLKSNPDCDDDEANLFLGLISGLTGVSRNDLDRHRASEWIDRVEDQIDAYDSWGGREIEPLLTSRVYEWMMAWLPCQHNIMGCIYDLSDLLILEKILDIRTVNLVIDARPWLKKDTRYRADRVAYYDEINKKPGCSIEICDHPGNTPESSFDSMHQKWLIGVSSKSFKDGNADQRSMLYGSYNLSDNAKKNIESCLMFPRISYPLFFQFFLDWLHLLSSADYVYQWEDFKAKQRI